MKMNSCNNDNRVCFWCKWIFCSWIVVVWPLIRLLYQRDHWCDHRSVTKVMWSPWHHGDYNDVTTLMWPSWCDHRGVIMLLSMWRDHHGVNSVHDVVLISCISYIGCVLVDCPDLSARGCLSLSHWHLIQTAEHEPGSNGPAVASRALVIGFICYYFLNQPQLGQLIFKDKCLCTECESSRTSCCMATVGCPGKKRPPLMSCACHCWWRWKLQVEIALPGRGPSVWYQAKRDSHLMQT